MKTIRAFVFAASFMTVSLSIAAEPVPPSSDFSGNWVLRGDFGTLKYTLNCYLKTNEQKGISGLCITIREPLLKTTGKLNDKAMQFKYRTEYMGTGIVLDYHGRVQPDGTVNGSIDTGLSKGIFKATPQTALAVDGITPWLTSNGFDAMRYSVICSFRMADEKLTGPCAIAQGAQLSVNGRVDGNNVSMQYDTEYEGRQVHVEYSGVVDSKTWKGTIKEGSSNGTFTADRQ